MAREKKQNVPPSDVNALFNKLGIYQIIDITKLEYNEGQIEGITKNPRYLKQEEHEKLKKSLSESPEFLEYKPLMVYALTNGNYVTICGNMRLLVANELRLDGHPEFNALPCVILRPETPIEKIKEYAIKDNVQAGNWDWDELANGNWEIGDLQDWGLDTTFLDTDGNDSDVDALFEDAQNTEQKPKEIKISVHIPEELEDKLEEIKEAIKASVADYEGVEIK